MYFPRRAGRLTGRANQCSLLLLLLLSITLRMINDFLVVVAVAEREGGAPTAVVGLASGRDTKQNHLSAHSLLRTTSSCRHAKEKESGPVGDDGDVSTIMMELDEGTTSEAAALKRGVSAAVDERRSVEIMEERDQFAPKEEEEERVRGGAVKGAECGTSVQCKVYVVQTNNPIAARLV